MIFEEDKLAIDKFGVEFPIPLYSKSRTGCELLVGEPLLENPNKVTKCSCIEHNILPPPPVLTAAAGAAWDAKPCCSAGNVNLERFDASRVVVSAFLQLLSSCSSPTTVLRNVEVPFSHPRNKAPFNGCFF